MGKAKGAQRDKWKGHWKSDSVVEPTLLLALGAKRKFWKIG